MKNFLFGALLTAPFFLHAQETLKGTLKEKSWAKSAQSFCAQGSEYFVVVDKKAGTETVLDFSEYGKKLNYSAYKNQMVTVTGATKTKTIKSDPMSQQPVNMGGKPNEHTCTVFMVKDISKGTVGNGADKPKSDKSGGKSGGLAPSNPVKPKNKKAE